METSFYSPRHELFPAGLRVLVVDDDPTWLKILEKMLRKCSYEVIYNVTPVTLGDGKTQNLSLSKIVEINDDL
ncbi:hypothetical protein SAY87_016116 [Trapa incisa]|uniref:Response regulatory domain-containing protein n=1 Tax=Trapa incisa TaxID=236973 RepID=A0AAN7LER6_9MYRT|nr:hypothetical protein SAY87_016116 [Trapa incisa]